MTYLESIYKTKLRDSEQLKTTFAPYNQDTVHKNELRSYARLEESGKKVLGII